MVVALDENLVIDWMNLLPESRFYTTDQQHVVYVSKGKPVSLPVPASATRQAIGLNQQRVDCA